MSKCLRPCSGLYVTSFTKTEVKGNLEDRLHFVENYNEYKKITQFPLGYNGNINKAFLMKHNLNNNMKYYKVHLLDYEWKNNLRFVRIYFDTPTVDKVTKDRAAKFVDMLSAIGGTMGLLTGFSIISGVEIIYFMWKITFDYINRRKIK